MLILTENESFGCVYDVGVMMTSSCYDVPQDDQEQRLKLSDAIFIDAQPPVRQSLNCYEFGLSNENSEAVRYLST